MGGDDGICLAQPSISASENRNACFTKSLRPNCISRPQKLWTSYGFQEACKMQTPCARLLGWKRIYSGYSQLPFRPANFRNRVSTNSLTRTLHQDSACAAHEIYDSHSTSRTGLADLWGRYFYLWSSSCKQGERREVPAHERKMRCTRIRFPCGSSCPEL